MASLCHLYRLPDRPLPAMLIITNCQFYREILSKSTLLVNSILTALEPFTFNNNSTIKADPKDIIDIFYLLQKAIPPREQTEWGYWMSALRWSILNDYCLCT